MGAVDTPGTGNAILDYLPQEELAKMRASMVEKSYAMKDVVYEPGREITSVQFPTSGLISLVTPTRGGAAVESAMVSTEGFVGLPVFLDVVVQNQRAVAQADTEALTMHADHFRDAAAHLPRLREALLRYTHLVLTQAMQSATCNRLHTVDQRAARWLADTSDRLRTDRFDMTQEFLADMFGVRRPTVSEAMESLQEAGLINYRRGHVNVVDTEGLDRLACECLGVLRSARATFLAV